MKPTTQGTPRPRTHVLFLLGIFVATVGGIAPAAAEIEARYYANGQAQASEHLEIKVKKVEASLCLFNACDRQAQTVTAEVTAVVQSASGLKPGAVITIKYDHDLPDRGWKGPRPIRVLEEGEATPAFLNKGPGDTYAPAARGASFQAKIPPEPLYDEPAPKPEAPAAPVSTPASAAPVAPATP